MPDIEKVIEGLTVHCDYFAECDECPYRNEESPGVGCVDELCNDAISLLKEQEAVEPIKMQRMDENFSFFVPYFLCGNCRYELVGKDVMFCHHCGRAVKR